MRELSERKGIIRKASVADVREIQDLIEPYAEKGEMLPRSLSELYDNLRDFHVYVHEKIDQVIGACAMHVCWGDLAEIRSLAIREEFWGMGIATKMVNACLSESEALGICRVFVLTYQINFFGRFGFEVTDKSVLPHKIWADCLKCVRFPDCNETAMILSL